MGRQRKASGNGANLGFEEKLWQAADKMRGHMDAAEYKHVALGLIFLKYISDSFEELHRKLAGEAWAVCTTARRTSSGGSTNTSWAASPPPRAKGAGSSSPRSRSSSSSSRCWS